MLERVSVPGTDLAKVLHELLRSPNVSETMVLSTCNRVEVYAVVETFHGGFGDVIGALSRHSGMDVAELSEHSYVHYSAAAVEHLFYVSAGLDSMVVGEAQILGQLRNAYATADAEGAIGRSLHELVQFALRVGKRVHTETDIDHVAASVVAEALADAEAVLGELAGRRALVVGAGSMGGLATAALRRAEIGEVVIANRTEENGARLARQLSESGIRASSTGLNHLADEIRQTDLLIACTGAVGAVVSAETVAKGMAGRGPDQPLVVCDLGLPKDVEAEVATLPGVTMVDLETLGRRLAGESDGKGAGRPWEIVAEEVRGFLAAQRSAAVTPTVTALRRRAAQVVEAELLRLDSKLPELGPAVRDELANTVRRVVDKLLHTPTVRVKQLASSPGGSSYADALRELFELDPQALAAVSAVRTGHPAGDPTAEPAPMSTLDGDGS